jgi:hypothetical protein
MPSFSLTKKAVADLLEIVRVLHERMDFDTKLASH